MKPKVTGDQGEELAAAFLRKKNYEILHRQYRYKNGELDIVAKDGPVMVFVEVKTSNLTRKPVSDFGEPETWMTPRKQKFLRQCAAHYLWKNHITGMDCRFDLIAVRLYPDRDDIRHIENAFWM